MVPLDSILDGSPLVTYGTPVRDKLGSWGLHTNPGYGVLAAKTKLCIGTFLYVRQFKPVTDYISVEDMDRRGQASGLTDCFWFTVVSEK